MNLLQAIRDFLLADANITSLVGNRVYPMTVPKAETEKTLIVYQRVSSTKTHTKLGPTGLTETRLQFAAWSRRLSEAHAVAVALCDRLDGFQGDMGGVYVHQIQSDTEIDLHEPSVGLYQIASDYIVYH